MCEIRKRFIHSPQIFDKNQIKNSFSPLFIIRICIGLWIIYARDRFWLKYIEITLRKKQESTWNHLILIVDLFKDNFAFSWMYLTNYLQKLKIIYYKIWLNKKCLVRWSGNIASHIYRSRKYQGQRYYNVIVLYFNQSLFYFHE